MKNDKAKFKIEFKKRDYAFVLKLIEFIDGLLKDKITYQEDQAINSCEAEQASWVITLKVRPQAAKEISQTPLISPSSPPMKVNCGWRY